MPDLLHSLLKQDLGHLRIIAELWGLELDSTTVDEARQELSAALLEPDLLAELMDSLSSQADSAIGALVAEGGRIPWVTFARKYGDIREMGPGKRDRERPHLKPSSTAEVLYYRGLLARAFFDVEKGPQEFAYIPDDLLELISNDQEEDTEKTDAQDESEPAPIAENEALGRPASPGEKGQEMPVDDSILDDATTFLAALRMGKTLEADSSLYSQARVAALQNLLASAKLIVNNTLQTEAVKAFLERPRKDALKMLQDAWIESDSFNELRLVPGIVCEGEWKNQPQETREFLLNLLDAIPEGKWWSLSAFIRDIKQKYADFQRPAGDYDSWFIKRQSDGQYLRGFSSWDQVDGALIKFFITNILHWLGQVDVCIAEGAAEPTSFRITNSESHILSKEDKKIHISSQGLISIPQLAARVVRYQVSRFCEWDEPKEDVYRYHISTHSLTRAREQGLKAEHLLALLAKHTDAGIPPSLVKALKRWEVNGTEARVQTQVILKVTRPEVLEEMRKSKAAKFLGEALSPTTVVVKSGAIQKVMEALVELGLLAEDLSEEK
ncbi:MAG: helicase-associated domain-containing protein [Chloroflexota bacterium]